MPLNGIGNSLLEFPDFVQWLEYTGIIGASLLLLVSNILLYRIIFNQHKLKNISIFFCLFLLTIALSNYLKNTVVVVKSDKKFKLINTHFPCKDKKYSMSSSVMLDSLINITNNHSVHTDNSIVIWPETSVTELIEENNLKQRKSENIEEILNQRISNLIFGCLTTKHYFTNDSQKYPVNKGQFVNEWYRLFNSIAMLTIDEVVIKNKEKLVPFDEMIPYSELLFDYIGFLHSGKFNFSPGDDTKLFEIDELLIAPLICYEGFSGNYTRKHVKSGANIIVHILNEGWFNNTRGATITQNQSVARSIENRKPVLRSSNCGYTSYIDVTGKIVTAIIGTNSTLTTKVEYSEADTFYQKYGDYIGHISAWLSFCIILISIVEQRVIDEK